MNYFVGKCISLSIQTNDGLKEYTRSEWPGKIAEIARSGHTAQDVQKVFAMIA